MAYTLLKNGGYLDGSAGNDEADHALEKRLDSLEAMLADSPAEKAKLRQMLKLQVMEYRVKRASGKELSIGGGDSYYDKVVERITVKAGKEGL